MRVLRLVAVATALLLALSACSGGSDSDLLGPDDNAEETSDGGTTGIDGSALPVSGPASAPQGPPPDLAVPALSLPHNCGFVLGAADAAQSVRLGFSFAGDPPAGPALGRYTLVGSELTARFERGQGLGVDDCAVSTQEVVAEVWPVIAATLEVTTVAPARDGCVRVEAQLQGLVLERPDGAQLGFGDILLRNELWGCS